MNFGQAIEALKAGKKVARAGWNGNGAYIEYIGTHNYSIGDVEQTKSFNDSINKGITFAPWIGVKTSNNKFAPWTATQCDMLSEDWQIVE